MNKTTIRIVILVAILVSMIMMVGTVQAATGVDEALGQVKTSGSLSKKKVGDVVKIVVDTMLYIIGIISVVMIIFGGIKYATSAGDSNKVTSAKNTLVYSIVGLVVAVLAYAIVQFVFDSIK